MKLRAVIAFLTIWAIGVTSARPALAITPESPEAKALLTRALTYLETATDARLGGKCLIGLVFVKQGAANSHPQIAAAVEACREACKGPPESIEENIYSTGIATIFLCEADPKEYRPEITKLLRSLELRQRKEGGWGYPIDPMFPDYVGDTSMTQYGALATWTAHHSGIPVKQDSIVRVCNWLLRTQDPSGAFGYHGIDPGEGNYVRKPQVEIRHSLCVAGVGSLYICAELLKFKTQQELPSDAEASLPPALVRVQSASTSTAGGNPNSPLTNAVDKRVLFKALDDANAWQRTNYKIDQGDQWNYYYLYGLERYESFRELLDGVKERDPRWYNDGIAWLRQKQEANGSWKGGSDAPVDTAFASLFIMRSMRKSIQKSLKRFSDGQLTGGRGLPTDAANASVKQGKIVGASLAGQISDLVSVLEEGKGSQFEYLTNNAEEFTLATDAKTRQEQVLRLRRLTAASAYETRLIAVKQLARARDLGSVPTLIYALSDPDARVVRAADVGLRFMARRIDPTPLAESLTEQDRKNLRDAWTRWYTAIRPEAEVAK